MKNNSPFITSRAMCEAITETIDVNNMAITDITFKATSGEMVTLVIDQLITYEQFYAISKALEGRAG